MTDKEEFINASESTPVKLLSELIKLRLFPEAIDSKRKGIALVGKTLERFGIEPRYIETSDGSGHLFTSLDLNTTEKGTSGAYGKGILLISSLEVPDYPNLTEFFGNSFGDPVKDWRYNPFSGLIINGRIYGAGSFYFLMPVVAQVMAICGVKVILSGENSITHLSENVHGRKKRSQKKRRRGPARKNKRWKDGKNGTESVEVADKKGENEIMLPSLYEPERIQPKGPDTVENRPRPIGQHLRPTFGFKKLGILILSVGLPDYLRKSGNNPKGLRSDNLQNRIDPLYGIINDIKDNHPQIFDYDMIITGEMGFSVKNPSGIMGRLFGSHYKKYITVGIASKPRGLYTIEIRGGRSAPPGIPFEKEDLIYILDDILKELTDIKFGPIYGTADKFVSILAGRSVTGTVRIPPFALVKPGRIMSYIRPQLVHTLSPIEISTINEEIHGNLTPIGIRIKVESRIIPGFIDGSEEKNTNTKFGQGAPPDGVIGKDNINRKTKNVRNKNKVSEENDKISDKRNRYPVKSKDDKNKSDVWEGIENAIHVAVNKAIGRRTTIRSRVKCIFKDNVYNIPLPNDSTLHRSLELLSAAAEKGGGYTPVTVLIPYYNVFSAVRAVLYPKVTDIYAICPRPIPVRFGRFPDPYGFPPFVNNEHVPISTLISAAEFYRNIPIISPK